MDFNNLYPDVVRFKPDEGFLKHLGFNSCLYFTSDVELMDTLEEEVEGVFPGYLVCAKDTKELKQKLRSAKKDWIVGVVAKNESVLRNAISRKKVDILLDFTGNRIDYISLKMCEEKDVAIEISFRKFLETKGVKRMREIEHTVDIIRFSKKLSTPVIFSSSAKSPVEMRSVRQLKEFFEFLGGDFEKGILSLRKILKRYFDDTYILDGLEIIQEDV
jgi:ribonuclease P/MRP protein subunit RPP1